MRIFTFHIVHFNYKNSKCMMFEPRASQHYQLFQICGSLLKIHTHQETPALVPSPMTHSNNFFDTERMSQDSPILVETRSFRPNSGHTPRITTILLLSINTVIPLARVDHTMQLTMHYAESSLQALSHQFRHMYYEVQKIKLCTAQISR